LTEDEINSTLNVCIDVSTSVLWLTAWGGIKEVIHLQHLA